MHLLRWIARPLIVGAAKSINLNYVRNRTAHSSDYYDEESNLVTTSLHKE